ncbi:hypothetical protein CI102_13405 [Trichoderma harzianum]|nr:hypothetical protein CI102_13405 [Trichoderma harzianum]
MMPVCCLLMLFSLFPYSLSFSCSYVLFLALLSLKLTLPEYDAILSTCLPMLYQGHCETIPTC